MYAQPFARIRVKLLEAELPVWRTFVLPSISPLSDLHAFIQAAMGWQESHLWEFQVGRRIYGDMDIEPGESTRDAEAITLADLMAGQALTFHYLYDFGDRWLHAVTITPLAEPPSGRPYPHFLQGAGRCPPEDVGGVNGFSDFLNAVIKPWHPEHRAMLNWYGGPFDPADINTEMIKYRFAQVANSRAAYDRIDL